MTKIEWAAINEKFVDRCCCGAFIGGRRDEEYSHLIVFDCKRCGNSHMCYEGDFK